MFFKAPLSVRFKRSHCIIIVIILLNIMTLRYTNILLVVICLSHLHITFSSFKSFPCDGITVFGNVLQTHLAGERERELMYSIYWC